MLTIEKLLLHGLLPLSFQVAAGRCLAIEGPSGSGKSILLRAIADLDPAPGRVTLNSSERHAMAATRWRRQVRYFAAEPGWWADTPRPHFANADQLTDQLAALALDPGQLDQPIASLSTGERQRLALLRGLEDEPKVLLLDEPVSALDPDAAALVEALIRQRLDDGAHVLLVSHDAGFRARLADDTLNLADRRRDKDANITTETTAIAANTPSPSHGSGVRA